MSSKPPSDEINILLLGPTGVGKTTFINALANYLVYDSLDAAEAGEMQVLIPASFAVVDPETYEDRTITIGTPSDTEQITEVGHSCTQDCRAFVFPVGNRVLRFIDAPGIGDTRGLEEDQKNIQRILTFINQYRCLNGICILLKPDEQRLTLTLRFCIKELLHHLHKSAKENIMFIFTHARITQFKAGASVTSLREMLKELQQQTRLEVPFTHDNSFFFDNEAFRFLALEKNGVQLPVTEKTDFVHSWDASVSEVSRLIASIVACAPHEVRDTISLNTAQQTIRKLSRPIAEIARLLQENIQLAEQYRQRVSSDTTVSLGQMPQKEGRYVPLPYPRTVCINDGCTRVVTVDGELEIDYASKCHEHCYLSGVEEEVINNPELRSCDAMNPETGICDVCNCDWSKHLHITYEYRRDLQHVPLDPTNSARVPTRQSAIEIVDRCINKLKAEEKEIVQICAQLSRFLHVHAITPYNDDIIEYLNLFIREEKQKQSNGAKNAEVLRGLQRMVAEYTHLMNVMKESMERDTTIDPAEDVILMDEVFQLIESLYELPLNGQRIQEQVEGLTQSQHNFTEEREQHVTLPVQATSSKVMRQLRQVMPA